MLVIVCYGFMLHRMLSVFLELLFLNQNFVSLSLIGKPLLEVLLYLSRMKSDARHLPARLRSRYPGGLDPGTFLGPCRCLRGRLISHW